MNSVKQYVINLKRRPDRLNNFYNSYPFDKNNVEVVYGFDGKNYDNEDESEKKIFNNLSNNLLSGEKGCFISHYRVFKDIVNKNIPYAIVLEDDSLFCENFKSKIEEIINEMPSDIKILYFGGRFEPNFLMESGSYNQDSKNIVSYKQIDWENRSWRNHDRGTYGYIISYNLAKYFIECYNLNKYLDCAIDHWMLKICMNNNIKILSAQPLLCYSDACSKDSDIRGHLV
jgi:GR25 family glycosyltransferase involved in LPS biosynthesis